MAIRGVSMERISLLFGDMDFTRGWDALPSVETIGLYPAPATGEDKPVTMIDHRHPMAPFPTPLPAAA